MAPGGGEAAARRAGKGETRLVLLALGNTACWTQEHSKQLSPDASSAIHTSSEVSPICMYGLF